MLNLVEVRTAQGALLALPLEDVSNGFILENVEGLDPVKATLVSSSFANMDGGQYHSSRREERNIKLRLGLDPNYVDLSVTDLRRILYRYFMPKAPITMTFHDTSGLEADIQGRVESAETALFSAEPAIDISVTCFNPDFYETTPIIFSSTTTSTAVEELIEYEGTVETGIVFSLNVNRTMTAFTIYHRPPDGTLRQLDFVAALQAGDVIRITTIPGSKKVLLTRAGTESSILYGMSPQANWVELEPGDNYIRVYAEGAAVPFTIEYTNKYGGL